MNRGPDLHVLEFDYPSASFGLNSIPDRSSFHYRFKILGSGKPHISFTDASRKTHQADGPDLQEGQEGALVISIEPGYQVTWQPKLSTNR